MFDSFSRIKVGCCTFYRSVGNLDFKKPVLWLGIANLPDLEGCTLNRTIWLKILILLNVNQAIKDIHARKC